MTWPTRGRAPLALLLFFAITGVLAAGCHHGSAKSGGDSAKSDSTKGASAATDSAGVDSNAATPVTMATVSLRTMDVTVSAPGVIDVAEDERVRAPFDGVLTALSPNIGDHVRSGETIGRMVALNSEAAWRGAHQMAAAARTAAERDEAKRAVQVADANMVQTPITATRSGVIIARPASAGERLAQGDSIVSIAVTGQMVFFADVSQQELAAVHGGERVQVALNARPGWIPGTVHAVMPSDTGQMAAMSVRVDLPSSAQVTVGLFGTATIVTAEHANVAVVPAQALVRDDITGVTKIALVDARNVAHWTTVTPGIVDSAWAEIVRPVLRAGQRVITSGAVGLPDSTKVVAVPDTTAQGGAGGAASGVAGSGGRTTNPGGPANGGVTSGPGAGAPTGGTAGSGRGTAAPASGNATAPGTSTPAGTGPGSHPPGTPGPSPKPGTPGAMAPTVPAGGARGHGASGRAGGARP